MRNKWSVQWKFDGRRCWLGLWCFCVQQCKGSFPRHNHGINAPGRGSQSTSSMAQSTALNFSLADTFGCSQKHWSTCLWLLWLAYLLTYIKVNRKNVFLAAPSHQNPWKVLTGLRSSKSQALHRRVNLLSDYMCRAPTGRHIEGLSFNCSAAQQFRVKLKIPASSVSSALLAFVSACQPYLRVPPTPVSLCLAHCRAPSWSTTAPGLWGVITPHQTESSTTLTSCWHPTLWRIGHLSRLTGCAEFDWDQKKVSNNQSDLIDRQCDFFLVFPV